MFIADSTLDRYISVGKWGDSNYLLQHSINFHRVKHAAKFIPFNIIIKIRN